MIKGIYKSASGMLPHIDKQDAIANNIANVGTTGFKKNVVFIKELARAEDKLKPKKSDWENTVSDYVRVDQTSGTFDKTSNPLDLAIEGDGFFALAVDRRSDRPDPLRFVRDRQRRLSGFRRRFPGDG